MDKVMSMEEAAKMISSGDSIVWNSFGSICFPEELAAEIGKRFLETGEPNNLEYFFATAGVWDDERMIELMSHEGMVQKVTSSHFTPILKIQDMVKKNKIEGYNLPLGIISHLLRAAAGKKPGIITKVGLNCFIDPRNGGASLNEKSQDELVDLMEIDGEEYLFYKTPKPNVAILRGTTADINGNITMEKEAVYLDPFVTAMAAKANGGKVIIQVERLSGEKAVARNVKIPGTIVDAIVVAPEQKQVMIEDYNPTYTGEIRVPESEVANELEKIKQYNIEKSGRKRERTIVHDIISRRSAIELFDEAVVNLGVGIPEMIPEAAEEIGLKKDITLTVESGVIGGYPASGLSFGAAVNVDVVQDEAYQFDYYDGGGLDITFVGALEVDEKGNVNVSRVKDTIIGVGGFINITQSAKKIVYCFPFSVGGLEVKYDDGKLEILKEGRYNKFSNEVDQISSSGDYSVKNNQEVYYITERCVFTLTDKGLKIIEVAPGISIEDDIIAKMPFKPLIDKNVKIMDKKYFE